MPIDCNAAGSMPATTNAANARWLPIKQWERQTPEERFDAAMKDSRLVDEAAGFISDADATALAALVAHIWRERSEDPTEADIAAIGLAYWTAITRAQRRVTGSLQ